MNKPRQKKTRIKRAGLLYVFREFLWPRRWLLLLGLLLIVVARLAGLVLPGSTKFLVDNVLPEKDVRLLVLLVSVVATASLLQGVSTFFLTRLLSVNAHKLIADLRANIHAHTIRMPITFFERHKSGELVSRIMNDVEGIRNLIGTGFVQLVGGILTALASLVILVMIQPLMTVIALFFMASFAVISIVAFSRIRPIFRRRNQLNAEVTGRLTEGLGGVKVVKGFSMEAKEIGIFEKGAHDLFLQVKKTLTTQAFVVMASTLLIGLVSSLLMLFGGTSIIAENMSVGDFVAYSLYLGFMVAPIFQMSNIGTQITESFAGLEHMKDLLSKPVEDDDTKRRVRLKSVRGAVRFDDVSFAYDSNAFVLRGISFEAKPMQTIALVGSSGAGKTTLTNLVAGFIKPNSGCVWVDGKDLSTVRLGDYRKALGVVLQDDFLFDGTIKENVLYSKPNASKKELQLAIKHAYVDEFTRKFKDGIDTVIGERGVKLSGGQKQRLSLARALLKKPTILILDEATSNLDTESEKFIQAGLKKLMGSCTTFVIAHRLSTIQNADNILVVENGKIVETGKHQSLMRKRGRYHKLYTTQARI